MLKQLWFFISFDWVNVNTLALVHMSFTYYMIVFTLSLRGVQQDGWAGHHLDGASADLYLVTIYRYMFLGVREDWC